MKPFELAPLPYAYDYLEPVIDCRNNEIASATSTIKAYVNNLNAAIAKYPDLGLWLCRLHPRRHR